MSVKEQLENIVASLPTIDAHRQYWLIRTESGKYFDTFFVNKFIALQYDSVSYAEISRIKETNPDALFESIKQRAVTEYPDSKPGLIANQILKFIYEVKKGDIVLIPSENSQTIAFGAVLEDRIYLPSDEEITETGCDYTFRKKVNWLKTADKRSLDPYLYKVLFAHQAINNLNDYNEVIERSIKNFFITGGGAHLVLDVGTTEDIHAVDLFTLGSTYLSQLQDVSDHFQLDLDINSIEVKITLNSPGKIHFISISWKTIVMFGLAIIAFNGGGLKINGTEIDIDLFTNGFFKNIIDYQNNKQDRALQMELMSKYADSLNLQDPNDLILLLQQASSNKGNPDVNLNK